MQRVTVPSEFHEYCTGNGHPAPAVQAVEIDRAGKRFAIRLDDPNLEPFMAEALLVASGVGPAEPELKGFAVQALRSLEAGYAARAAESAA